MFSKKFIDEVFDIGVLIKAFFGFFEVLAGTILATSGRLITNNLIIALTQQEISEDPKDVFVNFILKTSSNIFSGVHVFAIVYLIAHGIVNVFLAIFLLKEKLWAYPAALGIFSLFSIYQIYRYFHTHSLLLLLLTIFDIVVIGFIYLEYKRHSTLK